MHDPPCILISAQFLTTWWLNMDWAHENKTPIVPIQRDLFYIPVHVIECICTWSWNFLCRTGLSCLFFFFLFLQCKALIQDNKNSPALWGILDWCTPLNTFCYNLTMSSLISSFVISFNINYIRILGTSYHTDVHMQTSEISSAVTYWK